MNCLVWNCQGIGGLPTVRTLGHHIRDHNPQIIFLSETKANGRKIESLKRKFDFNGVSVDSRGLSGGLALLWKKEIEVDLQSYSSYHIDVHVQDEGDAEGWRFTGFYGEPDTAKRYISWGILRRLSNFSDKAWLCAGDFNALLSHSEKEGGNKKPGIQLREFREALNDSGLADMGFTGYPFTWSNGWEEPRTTKERLDRACMSNRWNQKFPFSKVEHLNFGNSDHSPILIRIHDQEIEQPRQHKRRFKFESMWLNSEECSQVVNNSWVSSDLGVSNGDIMQKLSKCGEELDIWGRFSFGHVRKRVSILRDRINKIRMGPVTRDSKKGRTKDYNGT